MLLGRKWSHTRADCRCSSRRSGITRSHRQRCVNNYRRRQALDVAGAAACDLDGLVHFVIGNRLTLTASLRTTALTTISSLRRWVGSVNGRCGVCRWLIAGGAGDASGRGGLGFATRLRHLLAAHSTAVTRLVGAVLLRGRFGLAEVQICRNLGLHIVLADDGLQNVQNAAHILLLDLLGVEELLHVHAASAAVWRLRQQLARIVEHADGAGLHLRHARRHQMHDAGNLRAIQHAAGVNAQQHRGRRLLLLAEKSVLVGQCQMHACALHGVEREDGAGQLALQPALEIQTLLKLGDAEFAVFHQLKASHRAFGQALRGQLQAHIVHAVCRDQDGAAAFAVLVRHVHLRQLRHDGTAILVADIGEQHLVIRLAVEHRRGHDTDGDQRSQCTPAKTLTAIERIPALRHRRAGNRHSIGDRYFSYSRHLGSMVSDPTRGLASSGLFGLTAIAFPR